MPKPRENKSPATKFPEGRLSSGGGYARPNLSAADVKSIQKTEMDRSKPKSDYDYRNAIKAGLQPKEEGAHWPSRVPSGANEGLILKLPGHETLGIAVKEDQRLGYETVMRGNRMYSYKKGDPRLSMQPRTRDLSAAMPYPKRKKEKP